VVQVNVMKISLCTRISLYFITVARAYNLNKNLISAVRNNIQK